MKTGDELLDALIGETLEPEGFSHRDHVAAAFAALRRYEFFEAMRVCADGLRALTVRAGVPEKFNATVTLTFMCLIAERMAEGYADADAMLAAHPDLAGPGLMATWYSKGRLGGDLARQVAVMPDRFAALNG